MTMEEGVRYVQLTDALVEVDSNGEHNTDGGGFDDRTESLCEVDTTT